MGTMKGSALLPDYRIDVRIQNNPSGVLRADQKVDADRPVTELASGAVVRVGRRKFARLVFEG